MAWPKEQEASLFDFLKSLRVAINYFSTYFKGHPAVVKAVDDLLVKLTKAIELFGEINFDVTSAGLKVNGEKLPSVKVVSELAVIFHRQRIKSLTFLKTVKHQSLMNFLTASVSGDDFFSIYGPLEPEFLGIAAVKLDYSSILSAVDQPGSLLRLFDKARSEKDSRLIGELADAIDFSGNKFNFGPDADQAKFIESLTGLAEYLKENDSDRFKVIAEKIFEGALSGRFSKSDPGYKKLEDIIKGLSTDIVTEIFLGQVSNNPNFDKNAFSLFSELFNHEQHRQIASSLATKLNQDERDIADTVERLKNIFLNDQSLVLDIYQQTLIRLFNDNRGYGDKVFDRDEIKHNYFYILLNLFILEVEPDQLQLILNLINASWDEIVGREGFGFVGNILEAIEKKQVLDPALGPVFSAVRGKILLLSEQWVLAGEKLAYFDLFLTVASELTCSRDEYIAAIFKSDNFPSPALTCYLKFFPKDFYQLIDRIQERKDDLNFLKKMVNQFSSLKTRQGLAVLREIFNFATPVIKLEVLRAMEGLAAVGLFDAELLLMAINTEDALLKKQGLAVISGLPKLAASACRIIFPSVSYFGFKNRQLLAAIKLVEQVNFRPAYSMLAGLAKQKSIFLRPVVNRARRAIELWDKTHD